MTFTRALSRRRSGAVSLESRRSGVSVIARAQSVPRAGNGLGWRASIAHGDIERLDGAASVHSRNYEARLEVSRTPGESAQRAQFATGIALLDGGLYVTRPLRESFAVVDVGAPGVDIYRDGQWADRTDQRGRAFLTGLRPYEPNRISLDVDDLPLDAQIQSDELTLRPAARSGAAIRFPIVLASAGEVRIVSASGAPLREGTILVRSSDLARFPVARQGRAYVSAVTGRDVYTAEGSPRCQVHIDEEVFAADRPLVCSGEGL